MEDFGKKGYSSKFLPSFHLKMIKFDTKNLRKGRTEVAYPNVPQFPSELFSRWLLKYLGIHELNLNLNMRKWI
jgi:hypothetical protein